MVIMRKKLQLVFLPTFLFISLFFVTSLQTFSIENNIAQPKNQKNFNPKPASASVYNLGLKSYEQGDLQSAITYFKQAVELDPGFVDAYYNLGAIYKRQKNYFYAISAFQKAIEISPEDFEVAFELASCFMEVKNYSKAKQYFSLISSDSPKYNEAKQNIAKAENYLALEGTDKTAVNSPEVQAQLLADALGKTQENPVPGNPQPSAVTENKEQLLVNSLTKPSKENFIPQVKTITGNFSGPTGITRDSRNNIYIANFTKNNVERLTTDGVREIFIEKSGINGPVGLAIDEKDNLYIANYNSDSILRVTQNKEVSILVNKIIKPYYLFYDMQANKLFVTSQGNNSLAEINPNNVSKQPITSR